MNQTIDSILRRRSARYYDGRQLEDDKLQTILNAGQCAPYVADGSRHFAVVQNARVIMRLNDAAKEWARGCDIPHLNELGADPGFDGTYGAPTIVIVSGNNQTIQYEAICAASVENMLIAAQSLGVSTCWAYFPIFAFESDCGAELRRLLGIPDGYKPVASVLMGYGDQLASDSDERYKNDIVWVR